ncbi:MAG: SDR family NAD(P)-dependent oxidoreductase [Verrucomicrobia bacterium]|nr:SDR family NAD(P)-dependent oxidoreductase [Verrucomicrobiota bacterium]MCF7708035.1 SDR family NAD(P)-dependent oxidoreductase [Verrucomicrobiota bacterium]
MLSSLKNKWVLITGASSGIGAAAAEQFGAAGANVILGARRMDKLANTAAAAEKAGAASTHHHELDVTSTQSVEAFISWVRTLTQHVDVLINNAGGAHGLDTVAEGKDADWEAMIQSNILGLLRMTRATLPLLPQHTGIILNIGSIAGRQAYEGGAVYCGAKAAERHITKALRLELCETGVRVGTVDPGMTETEFSLVRFKGDTERANEVYEEIKPLTADDVAEAMVWAASRPPHVCIDEILIMPTAQAAIHKKNTASRNNV